MKSNSYYAGLFRVKIVGFGSSSNFCNKKIMKKKKRKKKKKKKRSHKKKKGGWNEKQFFPAKSRKHFVLTGILSKDIQSIGEYPLSLFCLFLFVMLNKKNSMRKRVVS